MTSSRPTSTLPLISGTTVKICGEEDLYSNTTEMGLYHNISRINNGCVPNATRTWVKGDFQRHQIRALMGIEKDQEILTNYMKEHSPRQFRRQKLLNYGAFLCQCSECSLEGEDLEDNEKTREEIREKGAEMEELSVDSRRAVKKAMKLAQRMVKLLKKLDLRGVFVSAMMSFYHLAVLARRMNISILENDPEVFKQEALKYAKMFGDNYLHFYNKSVNN